MTTTTETRERRRPQHELPELAAIDRAALAIGAGLILRAEQHQLRRAARAARTERARTAQAGARADAAHRDTFERRAWAGPTW